MDRFPSLTDEHRHVVWAPVVSEADLLLTRPTSTLHDGMSLIGNTDGRWVT